ncbi:MAG TPA: GGDEF domain-containing protein [Burkholderiales bacterium]|jgi:diguanylate cyclase (GGDEF)-like protein|nr:GGDEF domain-containing protein [Burkholderiales bacterium]
MLHALKPLTVPVSVLVLSGILTATAPRWAFGAITFSPYVVLGLATLIALWFNRGRAFFSLVSLLLAYLGMRLGQDAGTFAARATFTAAAIFVPLNILLAALVVERGVFHFRSYRWAFVLVVEILLTAWVASAGATPLSGTAWHALLDHWLFRPAPTPFLGRLLLAVALAVAIANAWSRPAAALDVGIGGALVAIFVAFTWPVLNGVLPVFLSAAGTILLVAVLQESHRMAFRDELTGLPSRRALEEQLLGLGPVYSIAMVDVDHFKRFNDMHGHDTGDQVLKLIGARLGEITGGGKAFRYGGEEFSVLFPDKSLKEVLPHLEQLRETIANYRIAVRTGDRRKESRSSQDRRAPLARAGGGNLASALRARPPGADPDALSVTVSIGVAERGESLTKPAAVIKAADEALYRAKQAGRNRVSI